MVTITRHHQTICPYCGHAVMPGTERAICQVCNGVHHRACWHENHGCAIEGCASQDAVPLPLLSGREMHCGVPAIAPPAKRIHPRAILMLGLFLILAVGFTVAHLFGVKANVLLTVAVIITALGFDFVNGMNDSGNAIATVISTRVLTPIAALLMAGVLNFAGAVILEGVAKSIAGKIVHDSALATTAVTPLMILCGLVGAIVWASTMSRIGLPTSMSHALIGGLVGVLLLAHIRINAAYIGEIFLWMVLAPVLGFSLGWLLMVAIMWIFRHASPHRMHSHFRIYQVISSAMMAFSHGANDAQKAMGIITLALISGGLMHHTPNMHGPTIPLWVKIACATSIALGTAVGGRRVIGTLGHKIFKLTAVHGFAAELVAALTIQFATIMKVPISTTHVISSSILGVGSSKRVSAVRWGVAGNIVCAWVLTMPTCGAVGALLYAIVRLAGWH